MEFGRYFPRLVLPLVALGFHAACTAGAPLASPANSPQHSARSSWQLSLAVDGGIAGIAQQFTVDDAGKALLFADLARGTRTLVPLTDDEHEGLAALVASRSGAPDVDLRTATCADCYRYEMTIGQPPKRRLARYDSMTLADSPDAALILRVIDIGRRRLTNQ